MLDYSLIDKPRLAKKNFARGAHADPACLHESARSYNVKFMRFPAPFQPGTTSIMREEIFALAVDVGYGCGNPNINHD